MIFDATVPLVLIAVWNFRCSAGSPVRYRDRGRLRVSSGRRSREEGLLDDYQIGQGKQGVELCGVLEEAAVAQLLMAEQVLDDVERVLDPGPHLRQRPLHRLSQIPQAFGQGFDDAFPSAEGRLSWGDWMNDAGLSS